MKRYRWSSMGMMGGANQFIIELEWVRAEDHDREVEQLKKTVGVWKAEATVHLERAEKAEAELAAEKERRVGYQDVLYKLCNIADLIACYRVTVSDLPDVFRKVVTEIATLRVDLKEEREAAERKAANKRHRAKIEKEAEQSLAELGLDLESASLVVRWLSEGKVKHIMLNDKDG